MGLSRTPIACNWCGNADTAEKGTRMQGTECQSGIHAPRFVQYRHRHAIHVIRVMRRITPAKNEISSTIIGHNDKDTPE